MEGQNESLEVFLPGRALGTFPQDILLQWRHYLLIFDVMYENIFEVKVRQFTTSKNHKKVDLIGGGGRQFN